MASNNQAVAAEMCERAQALLAALDHDQRTRAQFGFDDAERHRWFYTPTDHGGLPLASMTSPQHRLVWRLIASGLSEAGYGAASTIVGLENVLDRLEGFGTDWGRERGRDPLLYWVAIFGEPGTSGAWSWRVGGHHLSLHFVIVDGAVVASTPCFMGADPASTPLLGPHPLRPLGDVEDLARELVHSFEVDQRNRAVLSTAPPPDLVSVNRVALVDGDHTVPLPLLWRGRFEAEIDGVLWKWQERLERSLGGDPDELARLSFTRRPKGLPASALGSAQRDLLTSLLGTYLDRVDERLAAEQWAKVQAGFDDLHLLWAGSLEPGEPHYYRIQGGDLFIEYDNAQRGGNHVHTVWRDLSQDFGGDALADHYAHGHHHD